MSAKRSSISESLRHLVAARADRLCEYCLIHEDDTFFGCEVDHIVSLKHGGTTDEGNLAFACLPCNRHKGTDIGSIVADSGEFIRFVKDEPRERPPKIETGLLGLGEELDNIG